ncbi:hypothetical protein CBS101457_000474 [Exobasidium rhododendri]|nr:hypothetical protein CBS101457_000474 [Exobasidium rhododendri]
MASSSGPDDGQQRTSGSRLHARGSSSGNQSNSSTSVTSTMTVPIASSASSSTPTTSAAPPTTASPRMISSVPVFTSSSTHSAARQTSLSSPLRNSASTPLIGQPALTAGNRSDMNAVLQGRPPPASVSASSSRRDTYSSPGVAVESAASHMSNQQANGPGVSLFNLGGPRPPNHDVALSQAYGWRMSSTPNAAATSSISINPNTSSHRSSLPHPSYQARPSVASYLSTAANGNLNNQQNRIPSVGAQQHQQQILMGSPHRSQVNIAASATNWTGNSSQSANHQSTALNSGWTLADPSGGSGWANSGRICSGFEENQIVSFTWLIPEAKLLRDEVESSPLPSEGGRSISAGAGKSEVWTTQPIFGDGKWKLELVRTTRSKDRDEEERSEKEEERREGCDEEEEEEAAAAAPTTTVLSIYLTSMILDYSPADYEIPASIMIGIQPVQSTTKTSRAGSWIWREFIHHVFRRESEYYECHRLPSLSEILLDKDIHQQDAFTLTIQISTGPRAASPVLQRNGNEFQAANGLLPSPFVVQDKQLVHHSLMDGLERMLDCQSTGDVVLIVRERGVVRPLRVSGEVGNDPAFSQDEVLTLPVGTFMYDWDMGQNIVDSASESLQVVVRDRLLWAHSSILGARSEFFHDMLQSHFSEGQEQNLSVAELESDTIHVHGRKVKTLRINDADFTTIYWLLRYLYLEEVEFVATEDVRCAALDDEWMMAGQTPPDETGQKAIWQWTSLNQLETNNEESESEQVYQASLHGDHLNNNLPSPTHARSTSRHRQRSIDGSTTLSHDLSFGNHGGTTSLQTRTSTAKEVYGGYQRRSGSDVEGRRTVRHRFGQDPPSSESVGPGHFHSTTDDNSNSRHQSLLLDPHQHPCVKPPPASPLALYRLAHRYHQEGLVHLSKKQLISSLTPQTAFPTLLATNLYDDLYEHVKAYVLDRWELVSQTSEFERCCDEVSAGDWGVEAGRALRVFMRSLLSPSRAR